MPDSSSTGLYPADQWKAGDHYQAFDWSGYDAEDLPDEVRRQMHAETSHGTQGTDTVKRAKTDQKASQSSTAQTAARVTPFQELMQKRRTK